MDIVYYGCFEGNRRERSADSMPRGGKVAVMEGLMACVGKNGVYVPNGSWVKITSKAHSHFGAFAQIRGHLNEPRAIAPNCYTTVLVLSTEAGEKILVNCGDCEPLTRNELNMLYREN